MEEMGLLMSSWKLVWGLSVVLAIVAPNTAAGEPFIYNITLLRPWMNAIAEKQCEQVGYLNIICEEVQDEIGGSLSVDFNFLGVVPTLSGSTSLLFNATTNDATHSEQVLTALQSLVSAGRVHALLVSSSVGVIPHPQKDLTVWMVNPVRGPSSGGTNVTVIGFFTQDMDIYIGDQQCQTKARSLVLQICFSPALNNVSLINDELDILFQDGGGAMRPSNVTYTYTTDPTVTKVQPLKVILSGGIDLTVSGSNLDTVQNRVLLTVVVATNGGNTKLTKYQTNCRGSSATEMICPTATIILGDVLKRRRRKRRQVESVNTREMIDVEILFTLDGVQPIKPSGYKTLQVFEDPVLVPFEPPSFTQTLRGTTITIQGRDLLGALTQADYAVTVGGESCTNIKVLSTQIECEPPETQPKTEGPSVLGPGRIPVIVHYVGQVSEVGFLLYPGNNLRNILIGIGVILCCLVITLVSVGVYCHSQHSRNISVTDPDRTPYTKPSRFDKPGTFRKAPMMEKETERVQLPRSKSKNPRGFSEHQSRYQQRGNDGHNQYGRHNQNGHQNQNDHQNQNGHQNQYGRQNQNGHQNQYGRQNQNGHQNQYGQQNQNARQNQNGRQYGDPADPRPSRQVWPGTRQSGSSPGSSAAYVHRAAANSIMQHRAMLPAPSRHPHAAVWNWDDHA